MKKTILNRPILSWVFRLIASVILLQTLYFKFTGAPESIFIFQTLGIEPWGRFLTGVIELIASIFLLINPLSWIGSILSLGTMSGAIMGHLSKIGIEVQGDGGLLFGLACIVFITSMINLYFERKKIWIIGSKL